MSVSLSYSSGLWGEARAGVGAFYFDTVPISANFSATPLSGYHGASGLAVSFTDLSTNIPETWLWDFGDGVTSGESNPIHIYTGCGDFDVTLTVGKLVF